ncbi:YheU family protein [Halopseudomonas maritima]|uniref:YheU family protein n=1 Tax=Halopseudomonas maritima TaxID=2918528 RepID=UPI001EEC4728|nr:YheU family protein [Halopseudomonas maritima]UJJ32124.1 YheU family protein [Halopseudomonas maritima]
MLIPYQMLEPTTLDALLEDFVTRDGTDNGYEDSLERRVLQVRRILEKGDVLIVFHPDTGDTSLAHRHSIPAEMLRAFQADQQ